MGPSPRTLSILMLLAGISMGVFAGTLVADDPAPQLGTHKAGDAANLRAKHYQDVHGLDEVQTDAIRQALVRHHRLLHDKLRALWQEHDVEFKVLSLETEQRIDRILTEAGVTPEGR